MATDTAGSGQLAGARARVGRDGLADDEAIGNELANGLARVGVRDFVDFVGIEPDLALATANNRGSETLLSAEVDPAELSCQLHSTPKPACDLENSSSPGRSLWNCMGGERPPTGHGQRATDAVVTYLLCGCVR